MSEDRRVSSCPYLQRLFSPGVFSRSAGLWRWCAFVPLLGVLGSCGIGIVAALLLHSSTPEGKDVRSIHSRLSAPTAPSMSRSARVQRHSETDDSDTTLTLSAASVGEVQSGEMNAATDEMPMKFKSSDGRSFSSNPGAILKERMIARTISFDMYVNDVKLVSEKIQKMVSEYKGYISDASVSSHSSLGVATNGFLNVRIPVERAAPFTNEVQCLGSRLISSREEGRDVTAEYVDSSARLETLRVSKKQLAALMERATSVADVLSVRSELDRVIGDIEAFASRLQYLEKSTSMSTVRVSLLLDPSRYPSESPPPSSSWSPTSTFLKAMLGVKYLLHFLIDAAIYSIVLGVPISLFVLLVWWTSMAVVRRVAFREQHG